MSRSQFPPLPEEILPAYPHAAIAEVFPDVFVVRGTKEFAPGFAIPRNMTVLRSGRELTLVNAVRLSPEGEEELAKLGDVKHLVRIACMHDMDDPYYVQRYHPTFWAPEGMRHRLGIRADRTLAAGAPSPIQDATVLTFDLAVMPEAAILVPRHGGVLLTGDSVQSWETYEGCSEGVIPQLQQMGFKGAALIGPLWRKALEKPGGPTLRGDFERLLELPFAHFIGAHGAPLKDRGREELRATVDATFT